MADPTFWLTDPWIQQAKTLLDSYAQILGRELIPRTGDPQRDAEALFQNAAVVVSHGTQSDPILNYGNQTALSLWEMDVAEFTSTPSRYTAEPVERAERQRLLERTSRDGYVDDYQGVRITKSGRRFYIDRAIVWNLSDEDGQPAGQAATFSDWKFLNDDM